MVRRRILLAVQPRVLRDALEEVLGNVGLDEVLVSEQEAADRSPMSYDAAIVSAAHEPVRAHVVIEVDDAFGHVHAGAETERVPLRTLQQLLTLLDRFCPTTAARIAPFGGVHG